MNNLHWIWQTIIIFYGGRILLRLAGRKSISQMTITQAIVMIGIGSLLIQPLTGNGLFITFIISFIIIVLMVVTEYFEVKFDIMETISTGKSKIVIENGKPNIKKLKRLRMSVDRLETRLRQSGVTSIDDVKYATIEVSGLLGYELKEEKKHMTKADFNSLMKEISEIKQALGMNETKQAKQSKNNNIFKEIKTKEYEGNKKEP